MSIPVPYLDDRRFQDFVDDAKRLVQRRCPEWTDHNVGDPGVTLIEAFAMMADQLTYRLNRVPDRNYLRFLELIGVRLFPATAARVPVTFWLSAPQDRPVLIPAATEVATRRETGHDPVGFTTLEPLTVVPVELTELRSAGADGAVTDHADALAAGQAVPCFSRVPVLDDTILFGLTEAAPSNALALRVECSIEGIGVDPDAPPVVFEAWTGEGWTGCDVDHDDTGGFNRPGDIVLHLPSSHTVHLIGGLRAGWVRARVVPPRTGRTAYSNSPTITKISAFTIGGTSWAIQAEQVHNEVVGQTEGTPGERLPVSRTPVLPDQGECVLEVSDPDDPDGGWQEWTRVQDFAESSSGDRHFVLDGAIGEVELGPCVRLEDGSLRQYGAVPGRGSMVRLRSYCTGGGSRGNVKPQMISVLKTSIPYVSRVGNRRPAAGGRDAETIDNAKLRGPLQLRTRQRAVTAEDYEYLARQAAPEAARVRCVPASSPEEAGLVRLLVVPSLGADVGRVRFDALTPPESTLRSIAGALEERRVLGARVVVEPPVYQGLTVVAVVRARREAEPEKLREEALATLYRFYSPVAGGPDGDGWPFGRPIQYGEVFAVLQQLKGVDLVDDVRLFPADPVTGVRGEVAQKIDVAPNALVFSYDHQVRVVTRA
jgi:predicted phage baseplate assembly protein